MTLTRSYLDAKQEIIHLGCTIQFVHLLVWPKQILRPLYKSCDLSPHLIKELSIFSYYLGTNNISLDKSYDLSTYPFNIYIFNNKNK